MPVKSSWLDAAPSPSPRELRRRCHLGEFVHCHLQQDAAYISCDGGRVCRPLIICDQGVPRVRQEHITKLRSGGRGVWA